MKFLYLFFFLFFLGICNLLAQTGCNLGDDIYPNLTAEIYSDCPIPTCSAIPVYSTSGATHLVNTNEAACGVPRNSVNTTYLGPCKVKTGPSTYASGNLNSYDPTLNDCPIDNGTLILLFGFSVIGVFSINRVLLVTGTA